VKKCGSQPRTPQSDKSVSNLLFKHQMPDKPRNLKPGTKDKRHCLCPLSTPGLRGREGERQQSVVLIEDGPPSEMAWDAPHEPIEVLEVVDHRISGTEFEIQH
jgi:hypothetical protein